MFRAGKAAKVDLLKIEVRLGELDQRIIREEDLLKRQKLLLLNPMGLAMNADSLRLSSDLDSTDQNLVLAWNLEEVYAQRSDCCRVGRVSMVCGFDLSIQGET